MTLKQQIAKAEKDFREAVKRLQKLKEQDREENELPAMRKMIGQCFKFRNNYSGGESWWMYAKIVGVTDDSFRTLTIQQDANGTIEIRAGRHIGLQSPASLGDGYLPISESEYMREATPHLAVIENLQFPLRK